MSPPALQFSGGPAPPPVPAQTALLVAVAGAVTQLVSANITSVTAAPGGVASNATLLIGTAHPVGTFTAEASHCSWKQ